jgi:hypothetical protein
MQLTLMYAREEAGVIRGVGWISGVERGLENIIFLCNCKETCKFVNELFVIHCAGLCLLFLALRVYMPFGI